MEALANTMSHHLQALNTQTATDHSKPQAGKQLSPLSTAFVPNTAPILSFPHAVYMGKQNGLNRRTAPKNPNIEARFRAARKGKSSKGANSCHQKLDNILVMIRQERLNLLQGPRITIWIGNTQIKDISKCAAMAASSTLNEHFTKHNHMDDYFFAKNKVCPIAVRVLLLDWITSISDEFEAHLVPAQKTFEANLAVLRASRFLGMDQYTHHIHAEIVSAVKTQLLTYEEIEAVMRYKIHAKDPVWTSMVNNLCHVRHRKEIPDPEVFTAFLDRHPGLKDTLATNDAYFSGVAARHREAKDAENRTR